MRFGPRATEGGGDGQPTEIGELQSRHGGPMNRAMMEADSGGGCGCGCKGSIPAPHAVNRTTADEVWRGIRQRGRRESREQQPALGEMILEDFLVNAKVGAEDSGIAFMPREHWLQHRHCDHHHQQLQASALASDNPATSDPQTPGRKRAAGGEVSEKTAERRHKRLIKNRESAARSRARKQVGHMVAYTNELENKISLLQEENERLKKQKELESAIHEPQPDTKYQLRRTRSVPF